MSLTVNAKTYAADAVQRDSVAYAGPAHTVSAKDTIKLARTAPKPTEAFSGVGRYGAKLTRTLTLTGAKTTVADAIFDLTVQVPVGSTSADIDTLIGDMSVYLGTTGFKDAVKRQLINL